MTARVVLLALLAFAGGYLWRDAAAALALWAATGPAASSAPADQAAPAHATVKAGVRPAGERPRPAVAGPRRAAPKSSASAVPGPPLVPVAPGPAASEVLALPALELGACLADNTFRGSRFLVRVRTDAAGGVAELALVGAEFLAPREASCVRARIRTAGLHAPPGTRLLLTVVL